MISIDRSACGVWRVACTVAEHTVTVNYPACCRRASGLSVRPHLPGLGAKQAGGQTDTCATEPTTTCHAEQTGSNLAAVMAPLWSALISLVFLGLICIPAFPAELYDEHDFDGLPGVQHEFKVNIAPGREECFFQMVKRSATLHLSFQVSMSS